MPHLFEATVQLCYQCLVDGELGVEPFDVGFEVIGILGADDHCSYFVVCIGEPQGQQDAVFDVARHLLLADIEDNAEINRSETVIEDEDFASRAKRVANLGVNVVICGAVSWPLEMMLASAGIRVIPQTCGPAEDVLRAFISGQLTDAAFLMPGCCGRRRRVRGGHRRRRDEANTKGDIR